MKHIHLDAAEPRCRNRAKPCGQEGKCARARAAIPTKGASIADFSIDTVTVPYVGIWCKQFMSVSFDEPAAPQPAVKPAMGGAWS